MAPEANPVKQELIGLVGRLGHRMRVHLEAVTEEMGLSPIEGRALFLLAEPRPMRGLAADLHCDASHITGLADRLEARGLVERRVDQSDRRVKRLVLTDEGRALKERLRIRAEDGLPVTAGLSPAEQETLHGLLARVLSHSAPGDPVADPPMC